MHRKAANTYSQRNTVPVTGRIRKTKLERTFPSISTVPQANYFLHIQQAMV